MKQKELVKELLKPAAYDEKVKKIKLMQTHISFIFLTGKHAYKVKKAVKFRFLDYSTLKKRKLNSERELKINKMLSPDLYLGVVPINKFKEKIKINGKGRVVEYAVKMEQLPQSRMMNKLLKKNKVGKKRIEEIALILANFHRKAKTGKGINKFGSLKTIEKNVNDVFVVKPIVEKKLNLGKEFNLIREREGKFIGKNKSLFKERVRKGKIRQCHGDVISRNIFIMRDKIYLFDALEFNKALSCGDIATEVAFLAMDLDLHNKKALSLHFVKKYIQFSKDYKLKKILNFYKCYRATVRALVECYRIVDENISARESGEAKKLGRKYLLLALSYSEKL